VKRVGHKSLKRRLIFEHVWDLLNTMTEEVDAASPPMSLVGRTPSSVLLSRRYFLRRVRGFVILVMPSGSLVKRPKVFSLPILSRRSLPYPVTIDWDLPLTLFKFKAREWTFLIKEYKGASWFASLWMGVDPPRPPPALEIPSPQLGREFALSEFENRPDNNRSRVSEPPEEEEVTGPPSLRGDGVALLFPPRFDASQRSARSNRSVNSRVPPPPVERLAPLLQRLDTLETRALVLKDSLPTSFLLCPGLQNSAAPRQLSSPTPSFFQAR
jgi:hypothetical protein